ncbi:MAG: hypothetical protein WD576_01495 [Nitriliruptoraceae bacterium]
MPISGRPRQRMSNLPTLATGEPILHRWFVIAMLVLAPIAVGVTIWALLSIPDGTIPPAARRPPGDGMVTIERGDAQLAETTDTEPGRGCGENIMLVGDSGSRAAARRALGAACQLVATGAFPQAATGLQEWIAANGQLRMATFERSGVDSSARMESGTIVVELNAKFLFEDATRAAPTLLHQLVLISDDRWPGEVVGATTELGAARVQLEACERLTFVDSPPRGCGDVAELLALDDPRQQLIAAGFRGD